MKNTKRWAANVRKVTPYVPGEQPQGTDILKLNTNENPYPPSPGVYESHRKLDVSRFSLYPELSARSLVENLAQYHAISEKEVFVGVGSDDVLSMSFLTFFNSGKPVLFPDVTYSFYPVWAEVYQIPYECQPLKEDFTIDAADYEKENGGIVIANPNAPTSIGLCTAAIEQIVRANPEVVVIIDEAYVDFGGESVLPLIHKYDNLLVTRTYSKSRSMAGMRIGYAVGCEELGAASLKDEAYFQDCIAKIVQTRERTRDSLISLGFDVKESQTNFLFASHESIPARQIFERLREKGIYVRYFDKERISNYLRITVGTDEQMRRFLDETAQIVSEK